MSSDYEFDDLDPETLTQLDYLESTQQLTASTVILPPPPPPAAPHANPAPAPSKFQPARSVSTPTNILASTSRTTAAPAGPPAQEQPAQPTFPVPPAAADSDDYDAFFDADESTDFTRLDAMVEDVLAGRGVEPEVQNQRAFARVHSFGGGGAGRQTTLDGGLVPEKPPSRSSVATHGSAHGGLHRVQSAPVEMARNRKTKKWDHTAFSKTGKRKGSKAKGRGRGGDDEDEQEEIEFEQFPAPFINPSAWVRSRQATLLTQDADYIFFPGHILCRPPPPMKLKPDPLEIKKWWYPTNVSKRDYQFNISRHCLFENTLVALPTGLGKTFIAGVVMLNYYKWFPEGKVIFVAPTKPLVSQQIDACHKTCGIPGRDAIELTGEVKTVNRSEAWQKKRVFYMTPQTLFNDLKNGNCDPQEIVLLVIDEAHRATGEYAYATVVRHLMAKNPHFRVLALSATPGGTIEAVQNVIDALHISHIECRHEENLDIARYMKTKDVKLHLVEMNEGAAKIRDLLGRAMVPLIADVQRSGLCRGNPDPAAFSAFRAQSAMGEIGARPPSERRNLASKFPVLSKLGTLARAMGYLLEGTVGMCYESLKENMAKTNKDGKPGSLSKDPNAQAVMQELERQAVQGFAVHPKMVELKNILLQYFAANIHDPDAPEGAPNAPERTCAMVFTNNRAAVEEIVDYLKQEQPMLRPTPFIGQGTDKKGKKGLAQREQLEIIQRFKKGEFNVMVSTSIGEEGLDIGEVDLVVCYESPKTPVRMLQRVGRTGRKRQGYVHVLLSVGREEKNWDQAKDKYTELQQIIMRGQELEFYADVERLIPEHVKPECVEQVMLIEEYDREATIRERLKPPAAPKGTKRKRGDDVPAGAVNGFVSASALRPKDASVADMLKQQKPKRRKMKATTFNEEPPVDGETDDEIEAGLSAPPRHPRSQSLPEKSSTKKIRAKGQRKIKAKRVMDARKLTASQLAKQGADDSDDDEIERGLSSRPRRSPTRSASPGDGPSSSLLHEVPLPEARGSASDEAVLDLCTTDDEEEKEREPLFLPSSDPLSASVSRTLELSPTLKRSRSAQPSSPARGPSPRQDKRNLAWLLGSDDENSDSERPDKASREILPPSRPLVRSTLDAIEISDSEIEVTMDALKPRTPSSSPVVVVSPAQPVAGPSRPRRDFADMPPPVMLPSRFGGFSRPSLNKTQPASQEPFFSVGPRKKRVRPMEQHDSLSSPSVDGSPALKRLQRGPRPLAPGPLSSSPVAQRPAKKPKKIRVYDTAAVGKRNQFLDVEAGHSGEELSAGSDDGGDPELSSEGDNSFLAEPGGTQMSPSYDQNAVYRQSLLSQAPQGWGPRFGNGPVRRGAVPYAAREGARRAAMLSSDGERDSEPDDYEMGSFVVDDEAEVF
ncbi:unnamed protein product [Peniophora sp. CBMAI 1063]|nr:unnamed protein product [Peniophora sp. CBMAI 1063]